MGSLDHRDLSAVLDVVRTAYSFDSLADFRTGLLPELRHLIPGDVLGYNDIDLKAGRTIVITDPPEATFAGAEEAFAATAHQHPGVMLSQRGDFTPHALSDFLTMRELQRLDLYNDVYRPLGAKDQIYFHLAPPSIVTIAINRSRRSFSQRDRDVIDLLEPHLSQAYLQAHQRDRARAVITAQQAGLQETQTAVLLFDPAGSVVHASTLAKELLAKYYPGRPDVDGVLPENLWDWLCSIDVDVANTLVLSTAQGLLHVRALSGYLPDGWRAVLLDEQRRSAIPSAASLRRLGLTDRQAQVLSQLILGHRTDKIADELHLSPATVRKHLENIYARLGVQSRTEAIAIAIRQQ